jgi:hypothetical protein
MDLSKTIKPKSDQLNADNLISGPMTVTVQSVSLSGQDDQPINLHLGGGLQPYKPCKSMRRLLIVAWGKDGNNWVGRSMTLFNDPSVTWAGQKVGGIRISHVSAIEESISVALTATRGKRKPYTVEPLVIPDYPQADFDNNLPAWTSAVQSGKMTTQQLIAKVQQKGLLSASQLEAINSINKQSSDQLDDSLDDL